jgi:hypothetical protein
LNVHIANLEIRSGTRIGDASRRSEEQDDKLHGVHQSRKIQVSEDRAVSAVQRSLTEDSRVDQILELVEEFIDASEQARNRWQQKRVILVPQMKTQLKKARKIKRLQEAGKKRETERNQSLQEIRYKIIFNLGKE